jgi:hypothetical protein
LNAQRSARARTIEVAIRFQINPTAARRRTPSCLQQIARLVDVRRAILESSGRISFIPR